LLNSPNPNYGSAARNYYMAKIVKVIELHLEADESEIELTPSGRKSDLSGLLESPIAE
jgi:hypothetical protein